MNFLVSLSESDKRVLIAVALVFILLLLLFGYLVKLIRYILRVQADFVDKSMYDIMDANLINDKKKFRSISLEKNRREFYFEARWPMLVIIVFVLLILIYQTVIGDYSWKFIGFYWSEASFVLHFPTQKFFGIPLVCDWPTVQVPSVMYWNKPDAWISYLFFIASLYCTIHFLICTCALMARNFRTFRVSNDYFRKDLNELKQAKMNIGQGVHNEKPTSEMQEMVEKDGTKSSD